MKALFKYVLFILCALVVIVLIRANYLYEDNQYQPQKQVTRVEVNVPEVISRLSQAIQIKTVSKDDVASFDPQPFLQFHAFLQNNYPNIYQHSQPRLINDYSLVYKFTGKNTDLKPILLMGHMDVVSVDDETLSKWSKEPFAGIVDDDFVWGRGAIDDKSTVMALMEAMELFLSNGKQLERTVYYAFGHDEEVGGARGAAKVAEYFTQQGIEFEFVLDEGGAIVEGIVTAVDKPVAIIGVAEKGFMNLKLSVAQNGGHSSTPPNNTGLGVLSQAIVKLENNQFPATLEFTNQTFEALAYYANFKSRVGMANQWLFGPVLENALLADPKSAASMRTTMATTMASGSSKSNILPTLSTMVINSRILPGDTWQSVKDRVVEIVDDPRVEVTVYMNNNPSPVSSTDTFGYRLIEQSIREFDPEVFVAPYLVQGGTDSKYYYPLSDSIYRFLMVRVDSELITTVHGIDERIGKQEYVEAVQFFYEVLNRLN